MSIPSSRNKCVSTRLICPGAWPFCWMQHLVNAGLLSSLTLHALPLTLCCQRNMFSPRPPLLPYSCFSIQQQCFPITLSSVTWPVRSRFHLICSKTSYRKPGLIPVVKIVFPLQPLGKFCCSWDSNVTHFITFFSVLIPFPALCKIITVSPTGP